jgi:nucleoside-diphosphate-sugar epimerase
VKVFVTGGTGVLGRRLIPLLQDAGHEVSAPRHADLDLEDRDALIEALRGVDAAFHLATRIITGPDAGDATRWAENDRLRGIVTDLMVDAAIEDGVQALIYPSITFLYPAEGAVDEETPWRSDSASLRSSEIAERAVQRFANRGGRGVILRFGLFWGPDAGTTTPNDRMGATIHVDDAASALLSGLGLASGIYNAVSDGQRVSNGKLKQASGWRPRY